MSGFRILHFRNSLSFSCPASPRPASGLRSKSLLQLRCFLTSETRCPLPPDLLLTVIVPRARRERALMFSSISSSSLSLNCEFCFSFSMGLGRRL